MLIDAKQKKWFVVFLLLSAAALAAWWYANRSIPGGLRGGETAGLWFGSGGTLLMIYSGLCLGDRLDKLDALEWAQTRATLLDWSCVALTILGLVVQFGLHRRRIRNARWADQHAHEDHQVHERSWWGLGPKHYRRAG